MRLVKLCYAILGVSLCLITNSSTAQVTWLQSWDNNGISAQFTSGLGELFDSDETSCVLFLNGHRRLSPNAMGVLQIPVAILIDESMQTDESGDIVLSKKSWYTALGNPYVGIELAKQGQSSGVFQGGIRLPLAPAEGDNLIASYYGTVIAFYQFEAFFPKTTTLQAAGGFQLVAGKSRSNQFTWKTLLGATFMKPRNSEAELFGDLNTQLWVHAQHIRLGVGSILRAIITEDVDDRFSIQAGLSVLGDFGAVRPQIGVKLPLTNDLNEILDLTYSLGIGFDVGSVSE